MLTAIDSYLIKLANHYYQFIKTVKTLNSKIGNSINKFISQSPLLKPFVRENWFVHEDTDRFHDHSERLKGNDPKQLVHKNRKRVYL